MKIKFNFNLDGGTFVREPEVRTQELPNSVYISGPKSLDELSLIQLEALVRILWGNGSSGSCEFLEAWRPDEKPRLKSVKKIIIQPNKGS